MRNYVLAIVLMCVFRCGAAVTNLDVYVSPDGDDRATGAVDNPVATIEKALRIVRGKCGHDAVTIYLRQGNHRLQKPVVIDSRYSGTAEAPVNIKAFPGETVTVSTLQPVSCDWKPYGNGIYVTEVKNAGGMSFDRLFVNGCMRRMARYPNYDASERIFGGYAADAIAPERTSRWKNPSGGYVHAMHQAEWGGYQYSIEGKDGNGNLKLGAGFQNNRMAGMHKDYRMVENVFEELDAPGEYFFDRKNSRLYYYPETGEELERTEVEVASAEALFELRGTVKSPLRFVNISGLDLTGTIRTFMKTDEPLLRSDWKIYRGGAVTFENTEDCTLSDCMIHHIGGNAVFLSGYNRGNIIARNHIYAIGASAVCFVGKPSSVRSPLFEYYESRSWEETDTVPGPCGEDYPRLCTLSDNLIHSIGEVEKQGAGVQISMASHITVSHNSIYDLPRAGINVSEGTWGGHVIEWNDVFDTVLETGDHGSFNSWGRDRFWHPDRAIMDSIAAVHPEAPYLDAVATTIIRNNRWRCDHGWDVDLDDGSSNYHIYNNLCLNGGLKLREGFGRTVENNVIVNNSFHPHVWFVNSGDVFRHNIVTTGYQPVAITEWGYEVDSNLFVSPAGLAEAWKNGTDTHSVAAHPQFLSPGSGDYRVAEGSAALYIGFRNFPMDSFGVVHPPLRALARTPVMPLFVQTVAATDSEAGIGQWNGLTYKSVTTEGERSAAGLPSVKGVLILNNSNPEIDLMPNDVVLELADVPTDDSAAFESRIRDLGEGEFKVVRFRNQHPATIFLRIPAGGLRSTFEVQ